MPGVRRYFQNVEGQWGIEPNIRGRAAIYEQIIVNNPSFRSLNGILKKKVFLIEDGRIAFAAVFF